MISPGLPLNRHSAVNTVELYEDQVVEFGDDSPQASTILYAFRSVENPVPSCHFAAREKFVSPVKILLMDDHDAVRKNIRALLSSI